jgi:hypothetical protein
MPTTAPESRITRATNVTTAEAPTGVAWPTVSATQMRLAPAEIAHEYSARSVSGLARVVSSVTYITSSPSLTANVMASSVVLSRKSSVQPSVNWRIGDEPMKVAHSIGTPVRCAISATGRMSLMCVRAAQLAFTASRAELISRASRSTSQATWGPAPGRPMSAVSMPSASIRWRILIF